MMFNKGKKSKGNIQQPTVSGSETVDQKNAGYDILPVVWVYHNRNLLIELMHDLKKGKSTESIFLLMITKEEEDVTGMKHPPHEPKKVNSGIYWSSFVDPYTRAYQFKTTVDRKEEAENFLKCLCSNKRIAILHKNNPDQNLSKIAKTIMTGKLQ